jgi:predicted molibdopterin-dependent oxidoreductase YjgC
MFKSLTPDGPTSVQITIDDRICAVPAGITVAAATLLCGEDSMRATPISGAPRGPYCLMGGCFECLVEIDGVPNRQGCLVVVREGMRVAKAQGAREVEL